MGSRKVKVKDAWSGDHVFFLLWESDAISLVLKPKCSKFGQDPKVMTLAQGGVDCKSVVKHVIFYTSYLE